MTEEFLEEIEPVPPHWTESFKIHGTIMLFLEITREQYETTPIPDDAKWGLKNPVYDDDGNLLSSDTLYLNEFAYHNWDIPVEPDNVMIMCCAFPEAVKRSTRFSKDDAEDWKAFIYLLGKTEDDFKTNAERLIRITEPETADLKGEE